MRKCLCLLLLVVLFAPPVRGQMPLRSNRVLPSLLGNGLARVQEPPRPDDRAGWVARLRTLQPRLVRNDYLFLNQFQALDAKTIYDILQEAWGKIESDMGRAYLLRYLLMEQQNPYLVGILHLGRLDPSGRVRKIATDALLGFSLQDLSDDKTYMQWRREEMGKPPKEVTERSCDRYVRTLKSANPSAKIAEMDTLLKILLWSRYSVLNMDGDIKRVVFADNMVAVRRERLQAQGLFEEIASYLRPTQPPALRKMAMLCLARIRPDDSFFAKIESDVQRELPQIINQEDDYVADKVWALGAYRAPWAVDKMIATFAFWYTRRDTFELVNGLLATKSLRVCPTLISMMAIANDDFAQRHSAQNALSILTQHWPTESTPERWREWWFANRSKFPTDVQRQPFPQFESSEFPTQFAVRHTVLPVSLDASSEADYWFVSSGKLIPKLVSKPTAKPRMPVDSVSLQNRLGLIVAFTPETETPLRARQWQETLEKRFGGGYIAILIPTPQKPDIANLSEKARLTVERMTARLPIDPKKIWLQGSEEAGKIVYACAFQKSTLFAGFWVTDAPFRLDSTPSLAFVKSRRFLIQHRLRHPQIPFLQATLAKERLQREKAIVRLEPMDTVLPAMELATAAIAWLEGKP